MITVIKVTTRSVDKEFLAAGDEFGLNEIGNLSREELCQYIEKMVKLNCPEGMQFPPLVVAKSRWGNFTLEAREGQLYASNLDVAHERDVEVSVQEAIVFISGEEFDYTPPPELTSDDYDKAQKRAYNLARFIQTALYVILVVGGTTGAWVYFGEIDDRFPPVEKDIVTNPAEIASLEATYAGTYLTGSEEGDLVLHLTGNGVAKLYEYNYSSELDQVLLDLDDEGTYTYAKGEGALQAILDEREIINLQSTAEIEFYQDIYFRYPGSLSELLQ